MSQLTDLSIRNGGKNSGIRYQAWIGREELSKLAVGDVIELDAADDADVTACVNGCRIASGRAVVVSGMLGVRVGTMRPAQPGNERTP